MCACISPSSLNLYFVCFTLQLTWFTPATHSKVKDASGYIEVKLRNVRSRDPAKPLKTPNVNKEGQSKLLYTDNIDLSTGKEDL